MPEYTTPGVYIEELSRHSTLIEGVATSTTAFVGTTAEGPADRPVRVRSFAEYTETFGPASSRDGLSLAVAAFFANGGNDACIVRVVPAGKGSDSALSPHDLIGDPKRATGAHALTEDLAGGLLVAPDLAGMNLTDSEQAIRTLAGFCEARGMFFIADLPGALMTDHPVRSVVRWAADHAALASPNMAVYFPHLSMADPSRGKGRVRTPPGGAVAGVFARTDRERGVWKPAAGVEARVRGCRGVEVKLKRSQVERLQQASINPIGAFARVGLVLWGARTFQPATADRELRYISVRRLNAFVEQSLRRGLQWVVFEPNNPPTWAQIRLVVSSFMNRLFGAGALAGAHAREAYVVRCGPDTTTPSDIERGRVIVEVGFAPLKPAEFVIVRVVLDTAENGKDGDS